MSRQAKGPRLYLRKGRSDSRTGATLPDRYFIRDGAREISTGFGPDSLGAAERQLADYIAAKWSAPTYESDPSRVLVADVLALYSRERGPALKTDAATMKGFVRNLLLWWGERVIAEVRRSSCRDYVAHRTGQNIRHGETGRKVSEQTARRELEVLSAAIGYYDKEHQLTRRPTVSLPERVETNRDALTREQAARLLKAARGNRLSDGAWAPLAGASRANRRHMARFVLIGLYTGSRSKVIKQLLWTESPSNPWVDLDKGMIYRRGKQVRETRTKRTPVVRLPRKLASHLARWKLADERAGLGMVLHHGGESVASVRKGFAGCVADAGLPAEVTPHWLRHTAATWLMERGTDMWEASGYLGMTVKVLEEHYASHRPDHQATARKNMA